jgi:CBS domain-containing protein
LSPRAAARLETIGFHKVYDYMPGKMDWLAYGLPVEKKDPGVMMVIERLQKEFPIARQNDRVGGVRLRMERAGLAICPVLSPEGVLLGVLEHLNESDPAAPVENVMDPGPTTVRPSVSIDNAIKRLEQRNAAELLVTSSDGKLLGVFRRPKMSRDDRSESAP